MGALRRETILDYCVEYNIQYDESKRTCHFNNERKSTLDLYLPKTNRGLQTPVVLFVHGGGWRRGDKEAWRYFLSRDINFLAAIICWVYGLYGNVGKALARRGIACAVMSYPLTKLSTTWLLLELTTSYLFSVFVLAMIYGILSVGILLLFNTSVTIFSLFSLNIVMLLTNLTILLVETIQCTQFHLTYLHMGLVWVTLVTLWIVSPSNCCIIAETVISLVLSQGILLYTNINVETVSLEDQVRSVIKCVTKVRSIGYSTGNFNADNLFLIGHSAGGHLCSVAVLGETYLKNEELSKSDIKGVVTISPVLQVSRLNTGFLRPLYLQPTFGNTPNGWLKRCPSKTLLEQTEDSNPPFLIVTAERDIKLVRDGAKYFHKHSNQLNNGTSDHVIFPRASHSSIIQNFDKTIDNVNLADLCSDFIKRFAS